MYSSVGTGRGYGESPNGLIPTVGSFSHDPPSKYGCVKGFDAHPNKGILDQEILPDKEIIDNCVASDWLISASMRQRTTDRILLE